MSGLRTTLFPFVACLGCMALSLQSAVGEDSFWIADPSFDGDWFDAANWSTPLFPDVNDNAHIDNSGSVLLSTGNASITSLLLGVTLNGELRQTGGSMSLQTGHVGSASLYSLSGGDLDIGLSFDNFGTLDFGGGTASVTFADNSVVDLSQGTLLGGIHATVSGGVGSTLYVPVNIDPSTFFGSFSTLGEVFQVSGEIIVIPSGFVMDTNYDRPDRMRIEGTLRADDLELTQGGIELAPGGLLDVSGTTYVETNSAVFGGTASLGATLLVGSWENRYQKSTFSQTGGAVSVETTYWDPGEVRVQYGSRYELSGGTLTVGEVDVYYAGSVFQQSGGSVTVQEVSIGSGTRYELTGGTLQVNERLDLLGTIDFGNGNGAVQLGNDTVAEWSTGTLLNAGGTSYNAGVQSESYFPVGFNPYEEFGSFSSQGLVHSTNTRIIIPVTYSGRVTQLNASNLVISGSIILDSGGQITTSTLELAGGTLQGSGHIQSDTFLNEGIISPGESVGSLSIGGQYNQTSDGAVVVEIVGDPESGMFDTLSIDGPAALDGELIVSLLPEFMPNVFDEYVVFSATTIDGAFANGQSSINVLGGGTFDVIYSGTDITLSNFVVPEPTAASLIAFGIAILTFRRKRHRFQWRSQ